MQTSFLHPPFGYALFYLRSVAPVREYIDKVSGRRIPAITTGQIYWGAVPFVVIQVVMVAIVIAFPGLVTGNLERTKFDPSKVQIILPEEQFQNAPPPDFGSPPGQDEEQPQPPADEDASPQGEPAEGEPDSADDLQKQFGGK
jgi:GntP family gluconate:H+ symporter